jgi:hypothetical protein
LTDISDVRGSNGKDYKECSVLRYDSV